MGEYHGKWGLEVFTNARGVLFHSPELDPDFKYPPYLEHERMQGIIEE